MSTLKSIFLYTFPVIFVYGSLKFYCNPLLTLTNPLFLGNKPGVDPIQLLTSTCWSLKVARGALGGVIGNQGAVFSSYQLADFSQCLWGAESETHPPSSFYWKPGRGTYSTGEKYTKGEKQTLIGERVCKIANENYKPGSVITSHLQKKMSID
jgi:hypothetical protein